MGTIGFGRSKDDLRNGSGAGGFTMSGTAEARSASRNEGNVFNGSDGGIGVVCCKAGGEAIAGGGGFGASGGFGISAGLGRAVTGLRDGVRRAKSAGIFGNSRFGYCVGGRGVSVSAARDSESNGGASRATGKTFG